MANETYTLIQKATVGSAGAATIEFTSIPQTFTDLVIKFSTRENSTNISDNVRMTFNGATTLFSMRRVYGLGSGGTGSQAISTSPDFDIFGYGAGNSATASTFGSGECYIPNYAGSEYKSISGDSAGETNGSAASMSLTAGLWSNTAAITSISIKTYDTAKVFMQYTSVSLYGVAKYGVSPVAGPKASGGDIITNDGTYWIHQFLNSGTFIPSQTLSTEYLVVAGGGGGAYGYGGGGGAGGYLTTSGLSATAQAYTITVGAGGASQGSAANGNNGSNSSYSTITATGGGGGGYGVTNDSRNGSAGGSGGGAGGAGASNPSASGGTATASPVQGNAGGNTSGSSPGGAGGGGAGAVGSSASTTYAGGNGGAGLASSITGTSVTRAGGGGGGALNTAGTASGGGGAGGTYTGTVLATNGTVNTGGGAGGGIPGGSSTASGGSGIVIIRYAM